MAAARLVMPPEAPGREIRGAAELAAWWSRVPIGVLKFEVDAPPAEDWPIGLAGRLRHLIWRQCCAEPGQACADRKISCRAPDGCRADRAIPVRIGGGAPSWRMAAIMLRWLPSLNELALVGLGAHAIEELAWLGRWLESERALTLVSADRTSLDRLLPAHAGRWTLRLVTPWLAGKHGGGARADGGAPDEATVATKLADSVLARGHKFTSLALAGNPAQALGSHLAHHVGRQILMQALRIAAVRLAAPAGPLWLESRSNGQRFTGQAWVGEFDLDVDPPGLPWLALLALCGVGENADEGYGGLELAPADG